MSAIVRPSDVIRAEREHGLDEEGLRVAVEGVERYERFMRWVADGNEPHTFTDEPSP